MRPVPETPADPAVPGLSFALRAESLFELLTQRLDECRDGLRFLDGRLVDVQYTPGVGAKVLWKIKVHDPETGRTGRQLLFVRALRVDEPMPPDPVELIARYRDLRASKGMARRMPFRTAWLAAHDARVVVHAYPLDPVMPNLLTVAHPQEMKVAFQHLWQARGARVRRVHVDTLSYTPGMRAALQYEVLAEDRKSTMPELRRLVGKIDARRPPARLFAGHWAIWRKTAGRVSIAPPVGYVAVARLSLQEFLKGRRLSDITAPGELAGRVRKAARAIANVHALTLPVLKHRSVEKEMSNVARWGGVLSQVRPLQARRIESLSNRLRREVVERMRITGTIHADFHLANVLANAHGVMLIDWDQAAHGDPMLDVGRFLAALRVTSLRMTGTLDGLAAVGDGFLEAYIEQTGESVQRARLLEAVSLMTAAAAPFRMQREGWEEHADLLIDEIERTLDLSLAGPRVAGTPKDFRREIAFSDRPAWAMDRVYAQALLVLLVHEAYSPDIELTETTPSIKSVSRECIHVRWVLKGYKGKERWSRAVEAVGFPHTRGKNVLGRLEATHAAAAERPSALQLPRPLGRMDPLSLVVFEPPRGDRFVTVLGSERESASLDRLGLALAELHSLEIPVVTKERATRRTWRAVARRVRALEKAGHPAAGVARGLLSSLDMVLDQMVDRRAPTIFPLSLGYFRITDAGIATSLVHDIVLADPLIDVGSLLSELTWNALQRGAGQSASERLRTAYLDASGEPADDLGVCEALMLLRLGAARALRDRDSDLPQSLVDIARERFEAATLNEARIMAASLSEEHGLVHGKDL
ncbi:MAG: aminoglycoside phosphotransferase family protein [Gemmatimonadota bacterium]|nr:aminoglycoside phosphotransferase family protein [Gemmatimonadota bacterium]